MIHLGCDRPCSIQHTDRESMCVVEHPLEDVIIPYKAIEIQSPLDIYV